MGSQVKDVVLFQNIFPGVNEKKLGEKLTFWLRLIANIVRGHLQEQHTVRCIG